MTQGYIRQIGSSRKNITGFTIVELLIVIVVIAILAAIVFVTYIALQNRAENANTLSGVEQFSKAVQLYRTNTGSYPFIGTYSSFTYACVAAVGDSCGRVGGANDSSCGGIGTSTGQAILDTPIRTVIARMPNVSSQGIQCENKVVKGALYYIWGGSDLNGYLLYYLKGDVPCTTPGGSSLESRTYFTSGATRCVIIYAG